MSTGTCLRVRWLALPALAALVAVGLTGGELRAAEVEKTANSASEKPEKGKKAEAPVGVIGQAATFVAKGLPAPKAVNAAKPAVEAKAPVAENAKEEAEKADEAADDEVSTKKTAKKKAAKKTSAKAKAGAGASAVKGKSAGPFGGNGFGGFGSGGRPLSGLTSNPYSNAGGFGGLGTLNALNTVAGLAAQASASAQASTGTTDTNGGGSSASANANVNVTIIIGATGATGNDRVNCPDPMGGGLMDDEDDTAGTSGLSDELASVVKLTNQERAKQNLTTLTVNDTLMQLAQEQSDRMAQANTMSHEVNGLSFMQRITGSPYNPAYAGENIAFGQTSPEEVVTAWMNSPGHRANILNPQFTEIGVGVARGSNGALYWTQIFGRPMVATTNTTTTNQGTTNSGATDSGTTNDGTTSRGSN